MEATIRTRAGRILRTNAAALLGLSIFVVAGCDDAAQTRLEAAEQAREARAELRARERPTTTDTQSFTTDETGITEPQHGDDPASTLQEVREQTPTSTRATSEPVSYRVAEDAYQAGRFDEATELFTAYTTRQPENPWGHYMLGLSAWKAGTLDQAAGALDEALRRDPGHLKSWINLGRAPRQPGAASAYCPSRRYPALA